MKIRFCAALLLAALSMTLFTGCAMQQPLAAAQNFVDDRTRVMSATIAPPPTTAAAIPYATAAPAVPAAQLTKEEAIAIALKDAGLEQSEVTRLRTELDYDNGRAEYEVDFHYDRWEYDYEINAETGKIISFDKDLED